MNIINSSAKYKSMQIRHAILMQAQKERIASDLYRYIASKQNEIADSLNNRMSPAKARRITKQLSEEMYNDIEKFLYTENFELAKYEQSIQRDLAYIFAEDYFSDKRKITGLNDKLLRDIVKNTAFQGGKIEEFLQNQKINLQHNTMLQFNIGVTAGESTDKLAKRIMKNVGGVTARNAITIARTATNNVLNKANHEFYKENKIDSFQFLAILDNRTTDICRRHNNKVFRMDDPGAPIPPLHYQCRSTTIPLYKDDQQVKESYKSFVARQNDKTLKIDENGNFVVNPKEVVPLNELKKNEKKILNGVVE